MLRIPVAAFYGSDLDQEATEHLRRAEETTVLGVVRAYLRDASPEEARRFIEAVQSMAEIEAR
jgi:hypothetical protein